MLVWLQLIHKDLLCLVKQRYGTEVRSCTLASIKPEISQALSSLLDEIHGTEDARVMRTGVPNYNQSRQGNLHFVTLSDKEDHPDQNHLALYVNKQAETHDHFLSKCQFLPEGGKKFMIRARLIAALDEEPDEFIENEFEPVQQEPTVDKDPSPNMRRVQVKQSLFINLFYHHHFLTALSHCQVSVQHLAGSANTPSDFQSRNAPDCNEPNCQICTFIAQTEDSVVRSISVKDILSRSVKLPFTSRSAWLSTQQELLLDEIHGTEDARVMRTGVPNYNQSRQGNLHFVTLSDKEDHPDQNHLALYVNKQAETHMIIS